ncbi:MAG: NADPH:quinone oxidoreductase family protein [Pseudomonadota bacterium]
MSADSIRVVNCSRFGEPQLLRVETRPRPVPASGEVTVDLHAWGVNYVDALMVAGGYQLKPDLPFVPGMEAAGYVLDAPAETGLAVGAPVMLGMRPGAFAEQVCVPASAVQALPDGVSLEQGACFRSAFQTAYHGLVQGGRLESGEVALIHGAAGGMGLAAVQVAKLLGATVIATARSVERLDVARSLGADYVLGYGEGSFRDAVRDLTGGADVIFDPVGGDVFDESMRCLNYGSRIVVVGFTSGRRPVAKTNHLLIKGASVTGIRAGEFSRQNPEVGKANRAVLHRWLAEGRIQSHISHRFPFERVHDALQAVLDREVVGRAVLHR